jgi:hypothetical protein
MLISKFKDFYDYAIPNAWLEDTYERNTVEIKHIFNYQEKRYLNTHLDFIYLFKELDKGYLENIPVRGILICGNLHVIYNVEGNTWVTYINNDLKLKYRLKEGLFDSKLFKKTVPTVINNCKLAYLHKQYNSPIIIIKSINQGLLELNPNFISYDLHNYFDPITFLQDLLMFLRTLNNKETAAIVNSNESIRDAKGHGPLSFKSGKPSPKKTRRKKNKERKKRLI